MASILYSKIIRKIITVIVLNCFFLSSISWSYPDEFYLATQSIFRPIAGTQIRDIGIIRFFLLTLIKSFPKLESIPGDISSTIGDEKIEVILKLSKKDNYTSLLNADRDEYVIPCSINKTNYFGYLTLNSNAKIDNLTVFTDKEFEQIKKSGKIFHKLRLPLEEERIRHEEEHDTPLTISHGNKRDIEPIPDEIKKKVLRFFMAVGADDNGAFIREAEQFLAQDKNVSLVPRKNTLILQIDGQEQNVIIEVNRSHSSNRYINIPTDAYEDITSALVRELAAKCGMQPSFNQDLVECYKMWSDVGNKLNFARMLPDLYQTVSRMKFVDTNNLEKRDYNDEIYDNPDYDDSFLSSKLSNRISLFLKIVILTIFTYLYCFLIPTSDELSGKNEFPFFTLPALLALFFSVITHEAAHILTGKVLFGKQNLVWEKFNKVIVIKELDSSIRKTFFVSAGPLTNLIFGTAFLLTATMIEHNLIKNGIIVSGMIQITLGIYNLIPVNNKKKHIKTDGFQALDALVKLWRKNKKDIKERYFGIHGFAYTKSHPKPGGSPADYLVGIGEHKDLEKGHTISDYKQKVAPPVSDSTIRRDRQKLVERDYLEKGPYKFRKGYEYFLTEEGRKRLERINAVKKNAKRITDEFRNTLLNTAINLLNGEQTLLALDENLGREGTMKYVRQIIKDISNVKDDEALGRLLENLIILPGRGEALAKEVRRYIDEKGIKKANVIMITNTSNEEHCTAFKDEATIAFINDSKLDMLDYYPFVEVVLLTLTKALYNKNVPGYNKTKIASLLKTFNAELDESKFFDRNNRIIDIILLPDPEPFNYDELEHIYRCVRKFLEAA